jgi:hypothetical protein
MEEVRRAVSDLTDYVIARHPVGDDQDDGGIALADWETLIAGDPSLERVDFLWGRNPKTGARIQIPLQGGVSWREHPIGLHLPFSWSNGQIVCHSVDAVTFLKLRELAERLGAECFETGG